MKTKYRAVRTNGFASKREANCAAELQLLERGKIITNLRTQVPFELIPKSGRDRAIKYVADFVYEQDGKQVVADAKGFKTPVYRLKKRMMKHVFGIDILEL